MKTLAILSLLALAASPAMADMSVTIPFTAEIAGEALSCDNAYANLGSTAVSARILDFRLFVSDTNLISADGTRVPVQLDQDGAWQVGDVALLDFESGCANGTPQVNTTLRGSVPDGNYTGLEFEIGVPFAQNHADPTQAASPLNVTAMFWNWRGGYKFLKIEFAPEGMTEGSRGWLLHLGSTMCAAAEATDAPAQPCANPNRMTISLPGFDPALNTVVIDPAGVISGADLASNAPETSPGCMSFPNDSDCNTVLPALGLPFNDLPAASQQLVTMR
ncbi:MbnP family copper-binding protein [Pararhodobacter sp. CCB-MM2]|uniref:MbnP family copper-binding protein n=1 Tax=Pararhodobacter sp. CCB-MM2 TaxID=1786003 RepID=UPI0008336678|nr:MbnP family copper-binding protein [Pararhodobacter sp. CCB-MM2]